MKSCLNTNFVIKIMNNGTKAQKNQSKWIRVWNAVVKGTGFDPDI